MNTHETREGLHLDFSNPHHRRAAEARYFSRYGLRLASDDVTLAKGDGYTVIEDRQVTQ